MVRRLTWALVATTIVAQIGWILVPAMQRQAVTTVVVLAFSATVLSDAWQQFGPKWTAAFATICLSFGWVIEFVGQATGLPFGAYSYTDELQPHIGGVPLIVPFAWLMMAYPALILARSVTTKWVVPLAALGLAAWDLFLDSQMVSEGYWVWQDPAPALPGIPDIPLQNYLGWVIGAMILMAMLNLLPAKPIDVRVSLVLYTWMWIGGIVANAVFLDRLPVAAWGGVAMATLAIPAWHRFRHPVTA